MAVEDATKLVLDKFDQYLQQVSGVIQHYAPDAVQLGLNALRVDAAGNFIWPLMFLILLWPYLHFWKKVRDYEYKTENRILGSLMIGGLIFSIGLIFAIVPLCDIWSWVGIFYPEVYAVHKFLM